jgi:hypothetical protein
VATLEQQKQRISINHRRGLNLMDTENKFPGTKLEYIKSLFRFKEGDIVEHYDCYGKLVVKTCTINQVVVEEEEDGEKKLRVLNVNHVVPWKGEAYDDLHAAMIVAYDSARMSSSSDNGRILRMTRALFSAGWRDTKGLQEAINAAIANALVSGAVKGAIVKLLEENSPSPVKEEETPTAPPLVPISDVQLASCVVLVAEMMSSSNGWVAYENSTPRNLTQKVVFWETATNRRAQNIWTMAKQAVDICRGSECADAIEEVMNADEKDQEDL